MSESRENGRAAVWLLVALAVVGLAWLTIPIHVVARALLFLAVLGVGVGVLVGAKGVVERLLAWSVGLLVVAVGWPVLVAAVRTALAGPPTSLRVVGSTGTGVGELTYHATTAFLVVGLLLLAAVVLLLSARVVACLPPPPPAPRPTVRRRARLVEPRGDGPGPTAAPGGPEEGDGGDDDHGLLGGRAHGR